MQTAAWAVSSSASSTSSAVKGSGTDIVEWMPYSRTRRNRTGSQASHFSRSPPSAPEATTT
ncbi:hypothetical protein SVIOM74S_09891 [Streptomyces violarus]